MLEIIASITKYLAQHEVVVICGDEINQQALAFLEDSRKMLGLQFSEAMIPQELFHSVAGQKNCFADPEKKIFVIGRRKDMFFRIKKETVLVVGPKNQMDVRNFLRNHDLSASYCVSVHFVNVSQKQNENRYEGDLWVVKTHGWFPSGQKNSLYCNSMGFLFRDISYRPLLAARPGRCRLFIAPACDPLNWFPTGNTGPDREIGGFGGTTFGFSSVAFTSSIIFSTGTSSSFLLGFGISARWLKIKLRYCIVNAFWCK